MSSRMSPPARASLPLVVLVAWACSEPDATRSASGSGPSVVAYSAFPPPEAARWALSGEPELSVGVVDGDPEYQFSGIVAVVPFRGGLLVADGGSGEIRAFDAQGAHMATVGGSGEGPGEFAQLRRLDVVRGDTILAWDLRTRRVTLFDPSFALIETRQVAPDVLNMVRGGVELRRHHDLLPPTIGLLKNVSNQQLPGLAAKCRRSRRFLGFPWGIPKEMRHLATAL